MSAPVLSILIPNFNNGRQSSRDGQRDFIDDLFRSLVTTLADDPTPLEIIVADDGSTDDSLQTCRSWSKRVWPSGPRRGEPVIRLVEREHCGVLSVVANALTAEAGGDICCRLDGDIVIHTPQWARHLVEAFAAAPPNVGVLGPKQLGPDGRIHSAGSWILHPRGHHHVAQGADPSLITRGIEVDHVMGCFYCHRRVVWEQLEGYDESFLRGQTVDFGLRARLAGWRAWSVPDIVFTHYHAERLARETTADTQSGLEATMDRFRDKWGFDRLAPDLDDVKERYAGTPLLWNARVFGPATPWPPRASASPDPQSSEWGRYASDESFRDAVDTRAEIARRLLARQGGSRVVHAGCRGGLVCHLLAGGGATCTGFDPDATLIELGRTFIASGGSDATLLGQDDPRRWPIDDDAADLVLLFDIVEHHPNPVGLFVEAHRVLASDGVLAILSRPRQSLNDADHDALHGYAPHELVLQLQATGLFRPVHDPELAPPTGQVLLLGRRLPGATQSTAVASEPAVASA